MKLSEILKEQFLTDQAEIKAWLDKMDVKNYVIKPDGTVDVNGDVELYSRQLTSIPVQFGAVTGYFGCRNNKLTSLVGCPSSVGGDFYCHINELTSLEGIADQLTSMKGVFVCDYGKIKSHVLGLMLIEGLLGINCNDKWAEILNHCLEHKLEIYDAQTKLLDADLEEYAQL